MFMLDVGKSRRSPYVYTVLLMLLLTRDLCEGGEDAWKFYQNSDDFT